MPTPDFRRKRPAPRQAGGWGKPVTDDVTWTRTLDPREKYRIIYIDRENQRSQRDIELLKIGHTTLNDEQTPYLGVMHQGRFKTLRADRVVEVTQIDPAPGAGHEPSIRPYPTYRTKLPAFPVPGAVYKMPTTAASNRTWTVDLNAYTCTCPEKRIRSGFGYEPGELGFACDHMAKAILAHLPAGSADWTPELLQFLGNPRRVHIDNLA